MRDQQTIDQFNERTMRMESLTTSNFTCPHCREVVRFVCQYDSSLKNVAEERDHYKQLAERLMQDNFNLRMFCRRLAQL